MSICDNQEEFNKAFYNALKHSKKIEDKRMSRSLAIYIVIHTFFLIWGIMLAFKSQPKQNRVIHITLSILSGPGYVVAYYLNLF